MADNEYTIRRELKRLSAIRGSGTELISVYIPPDFAIADEMGKLKEESSQAGNIKSKSTRQNVQGALDKIIQFLRLYKRDSAQWPCHIRWQHLQYSIKSQNRGLQD